MSNLKDYELSDKAVIYILAKNNEIIASSNDFTPIQAFNYNALSDIGDYVYDEMTINKWSLFQLNQKLMIGNMLF